ncbi:PA0069 family radical SAM protein [bacterium]|nr:PA0069 family radical SAM protein [bacterium]
MSDGISKHEHAGIAVRGRGTGELPKGRFERFEVTYEQGEATQVRTECFHDRSKTILATNDSPDVGFGVTLNPYRGCEHGCIYCYARPTHEYLGMSAGLDFERKLMVKMDAPQLLREKLASKAWRPQVIGMSGVTDCYQPVEKTLELTRQCLQVLAEFRNPVVIITKNQLVTRDIDLLKELATYQAVHVVVSVTSLEDSLARRMEPRASTPQRRLEAIRMLSEAGIPVSVNVAPIIPGLTEHEIPAVLKAVAEAGARNAHYVMLRLPYGVKDLFQDWLEEHYPLRKKKVLSHLTDVRNGKLYTAEFGDRMRGQGPYAEQVAQMFAHYKKRYGLSSSTIRVSAEHFRRVRVDAQMSLFEEG